MDMDYTCNNKCCRLQIDKYVQPQINTYYRKRKKAGVFIFDPKTDKILLVQSRGNLWGPPKGGINQNETERNCAVREVKEETGLDIDMDNFTKAIKIKNKAIYFYLEQSECDVNIQRYLGNDANGIGWIKIECLHNLLDKGEISLSKHCFIVLKKFLNIDLESYHTN